LTKFQYINENLNQIKQEVKQGLISISVLRQYEIYSRYDYYRKLSHPVGLAVMFTSEDLNVKERWIFIIKKQMESEI
jgi:hypothetical protein